MEYTEMENPRRKSNSQFHPNTATMQVILFHELIVEILSYLPVKSLMQMKCVCKSWKTLISDKTFIKMHLKRSARNAHLALLVKRVLSDKSYSIGGVVPVPVSRLLYNHPIPISSDLPFLGLPVGSCNGLICLAKTSSVPAMDNYQEACLRFYNPATRKLSDELGYFRSNFKDEYSIFKFAFGYDNSTDTYKVVAFRQGGTEVRVFNLGDNNVWRDIQNSPEVPYFGMNRGVYLSGSIHWMALCNHSHALYEWESIFADQFVIIALDLRTETYTKLLPPRGFNDVTSKVPILHVLKNCLCFSHDSKGTHLIIWQMKEYGVEESWTQLLKVSYQNLPNIPPHNLDMMRYLSQWLPLYLSETCDTLILANYFEDQAILYNWRDNRVERTTITIEKSFWNCAKDYVESLVWYC